MLVLRLLFFLLIPMILEAQSNFTSIEKHIEEKEYRTAEQKLVDLIKAKNDPDLKAKLGEVYAYQLKWDEAVEIYRELTLSYPENAEFFFRYGGVLAKKAQDSNTFLALTMLGRIKNSFKIALDLNPRHIRTHWALIDLYVSLPGIVGGSMSKAYDYARELKELKPLDGHLALGYVYEYDDEPEKARDQYLKALSILNGLDHLERNQLNYQIGKISSDYGLELDKGIEHLTTYIENYTVLDGVPLEWAYLRLAKIYRKKSDKDKALASINKSLDLNPELRQALTERSIIERL